MFLMNICCFWLIPNWLRFFPAASKIRRVKSYLSAVVNRSARSFEQNLEFQCIEFWPDPEQSEEFWGFARVSIFSFRRIAFVHTNQTGGINLILFMCFLFYSLFVCISAYANVYFKTTIIKQNTKIILIAGVPSSQAILGFLITAPPPVLVSAVLSALVVDSKPKKQKKGHGQNWHRSAPPSHCHHSSGLGIGRTGTMACRFDRAACPPSCRPLEGCMCVVCCFVSLKRY